MTQQENTGTLGKLHNVLQMLKEGIRGKDCHKELPVQMLLTLFTVMEKEGITLAQIAREHGIFQSTVSRNVKEMSLYKENDGTGKLIQKGRGLLQTAPNEENRRELSVFLTNKGMRLKKTIESMLE